MEIFNAKEIVGSMCATLWYAMINASNSWCMECWRRRRRLLMVHLSIRTWKKILIYCVLNYVLWIAVHNFTELAICIDGVIKASAQVFRWWDLIFPRTVRRVSMHISSVYRSTKFVFLYCIKQIVLWCTEMSYFECNLQINRVISSLEIKERSV